ncbi:TIGR02281 family clan AA aspartic protease [Clostridium estertheticum]|uniref:retropepsin-like aspartic protease family protein n=1 Tax=Clostridium estertheticum TaxID=238834 RepID=UPI001C6DF1A8|nr:retropepsin-like aspartic protease [Clostridium estertheticum]MBW9154370.1 retroviral-like aspartic protease family protein [Clostridium estertheticum]WLC85817.1 retroviral-like aspartic protease family protein [Clostridium estertheticum]
MVNLQFKYGLPFCSIKLTYKGNEMILDDILIDTGSGGTVLKMDKVEEIGITIEDDDTIETISGIGGSEFVYKKYVDSIRIGDLNLYNFKIEIGVMDYGFEINGIIGMDFLKSVGVIIDLDKMILDKSH